MISKRILSIACIMLIAAGSINAQTNATSAPTTTAKPTTTTTTTPAATTTTTPATTTTTTPVANTNVDEHHHHHHHHDNNTVAANTAATNNTAATKAVSATDNKTTTVVNNNSTTLLQSCENKHFSRHPMFHRVCGSDGNVYMNKRVAKCVNKDVKIVKKCYRPYFRTYNSCLSLCKGLYTSNNKNTKTTTTTNTNANTATTAVKSDNKDIHHANSVSDFPKAAKTN